MSRAEIKSRIRLPKRVATGLYAGAVAFWGGARRMVTGAVLAVAIVSANALGYAALAVAEPNSGGTWDIAKFDKCMADLLEVDGDSADYRLTEKICCRASGGVWNANRSECQAPPADSQGSRQLPGNVQIPPDIATAPTVTTAPPRPIRVPSDIATAPPVSQTPA